MTQDGFIKVSLSFGIKMFEQRFKCYLEQISMYKSIKMSTLDWFTMYIYITLHLYYYSGNSRGLILRASCWLCFCTLLAEVNAQLVVIFSEDRWLLWFCCDGVRSEWTRQVRAGNSGESTSLREHRYIPKLCKYITRRLFLKFFAARFHRMCTESFSDHTFVISFLCNYLGILWR